MEIDRPEQLSAHLEYVKINVQDVGHNPGYEPLFRAAEQDVKNVKLNDLSCFYTSHLAYHWTPISSSQSVVKRWLSMSRRIPCSTVSAVHKLGIENHDLHPSAQSGWWCGRALWIPAKDLSGRLQPNATG